jgi:hypothetical protein
MSAEKPTPPAPLIPPFAGRVKVCPTKVSCYCEPDAGRRYIYPQAEKDGGRRQARCRFGGNDSEVDQNHSRRPRQSSDAHGSEGRLTNFLHPRHLHRLVQRMRSCQSCRRTQTRNRCSMECLKGKKLLFFVSFQMQSLFHTIK